MYKQRMLITAVAAALAAGMGTAQATVNLDLDTGTEDFAEEIAIAPGTGTTLTNAGSILDVEVDYGFSQGATETSYVRFDLGAGATFTAAPTYSVGAAVVLPSQGGAGESFVIFSVAGAVLETELGTLIVNDVDVNAIQSVSVDYGLYETGAGAGQQDQGQLRSGESGTLLRFATGLRLFPAPEFPERIDVTQGSLFFETSLGDDKTTIGEVLFGTEFDVLWTNGLQVLLSDLVTTGTQFIVNGDLTAAQSVFFDFSSSCNSPDQVADTFDATSATFTVDDTVQFPWICMEVDGVTPIVPTVFTGLYDVVAAAGSAVGDQEVELSELLKNGDSEVAYVITRPDAVDLTFLRVTNKTSQAGAVFVTLYAQDGSILGTGGSTLIDPIGGNETVVLSSADIAAAVGVDTWPGRARAVIEAEVPDIAVMNLVRTNDVLTNQSSVADRPN